MIAIKQSFFQEVDEEGEVAGNVFFFLPGTKYVEDSKIKHLQMPWLVISHGSAWIGNMDFIHFSLPHRLKHELRGCFCLFFLPVSLEAGCLM